MAGPSGNLAVPATALERAHEVDAIDAALARGGALVVVEGPAGIGKSTLLGGARARSGSRRVLSGRAGELEREFAYGLARQIFATALRDPALRTVMFAEAGRMAAGALGSAADGQDATEPAQAQYGLTWACGNLAAHVPLLLVVDDLHWADEESLAWLVHLSRRLDEMDVVVVAGTRSSEPGAHQGLLDRLREAASVVLRPQPLSLGAVGTLVDAGLDGSDAAFRATCHEVTGGNPFYLHELLEEMRRLGVPPDHRGATVAAGLSPSRVAAATLRRLAGLGPDAVALARAVVVGGTQVPVAEAAELAGLSPDDALGAVDRLVAADIFAPGDTLDFAHPVVRASVDADLSRADRSRGHRSAAAVLARRGGDPDRVAAHLLATEPEDNPDAARRLAEAADRCTTIGAFERARRLARRALAEQPPSPLRGQILLLLARLSEPEGLEAQADAYWAALEHLTDPRERAHTAVQLNSCYDLGPPRLRAQAPRLIGFLAAARRDLGEEEPGLALALEFRGAMWRGYDEGFGSVDPEDIWARLDTIPPGEHRRSLLDLRAGSSHWGRRAATAADVIADYAEFRDEHSLVAHVPPVLPLWRIAHCDRPDLAEQNLAWLRDLYTQRGWVDVRHAFTVAEAAVALDGRGDVRSAEALLREADGEFAAEAEILRTTGLLARVLTERGELVAAAEVLGGLGLGEEDVPDRFIPVQFQVLSRGLIRLESGEWEAGVADLLNAGRVFGELGMVGPGAAAHWWRGPAIRGLVAAGRRAEARDLADETLALAQRWQAPTALGRARVVHGLAHGDRDAMRAGVELLRQAPNVLERARGHLLLGGELRRAGERSAAREELHTARELAQGAGSRLIVGQAEDELRAAGGRVRTRLVATGPSLTPSEERVALLVVEGQSNRDVAQFLFLSPKTIEMHLGRIYRKLGISGRDELAAALGWTPIAEDGASTIVFTDIEGSSELARAHGDERWVRTLIGHGALVRQVARSHRGVVVKGMGDGFMLGFRRTVDAAGFAVDLQRALDQDPLLRIRVGLHTGRPQLVRGDLFGNDVNVAARITAVAAGQEILCSAAAVAQFGVADGFVVGAPRNVALRGQRGEFALSLLHWS